MVYAGRIDEAKGCKELFDYFLRYKKENQNDLKLVMMGKPVIPIPKSDDIVSLGFVSDQEKFDVMSGAKFLIMPSSAGNSQIIPYSPSLHQFFRHKPCNCQYRIYFYRKAILISTAHDEPPIYLKTFDTLFQMPKALFYLTVEEKKFSGTQIPQ